MSEQDRAAAPKTPPATTGPRSHEQQQDQESYGELKHEEFRPLSSSSEPPSNLKLSRNRTAYSAKRDASHKTQSKDDDDVVTIKSDTSNTPTAISMGASKHLRPIPRATSATNPGSQTPKTASRSGKQQEVTIADNDVRASKQHIMSREHNSLTEEVSPPRANKHSMDSTAMQEKSFLQGHDTPQPQPARTTDVSRHPSVVPQGVEENLKPSAPASQDRSGKTGPNPVPGQQLRTSSHTPHRPCRVAWPSRLFHNIFRVIAQHQTR